MTLFETIQKYHAEEDAIFQVVYAAWGLPWSEAYCSRIEEFRDDEDGFMEWVIDDITDMILESSPKHLQGIVATVLEDLDWMDWEEILEILTSIEAYEDLPEAV